MNELHRVFFGILAMELGGSVDSSSLKTKIEAMGDEGLGALYSLSKSHDLAHIVGEGLTNLKIQDSPILAKFAKQQFLCLYRYEQLDFELGQIKSALRDAKIDFLPLKGSVIRELYPKPYYRTSCDIDILVREDSLDEAIAALCGSLGYRVEGDKSFHDISLYSENGIHLELHFNIKEKHEGLDKVLDRVWDHATPSKDSPYEYVLTPEFLMFHIVAHSAYHFYSGGCGVKPLCDIFLLKEKLSYDEALLDKLCAECGIENFKTHLFALSEMRFDVEDSDGLTERMADYILGAGVYGTTETKVAAAQAKSDSKLGYIMKRIFIPLDDLKYYYPILQKRKWLLPVMWVRRWIRLVFGGGFSKSVKELKVGVSMPDEKNNYVSSLLSELGL